MVFSSFDEPDTAGFLRDSHLVSKQKVLSAVYKHIFGNSYIMEEDRAKMTGLENDFVRGKISVRDLVRQLGKSELYKARFFERCGPYRFIELNLKHFLGRGPESQPEISFHVEKLMKDGYEAEIDSYFDTGEYNERFGDNGVPRFVFMSRYLRADNFNRMALLRKNYDGCGTSVVAGMNAFGEPIAAQLIMGHAEHVNDIEGIRAGLPSRYRVEPLQRAKPPSGMVEPVANPKLEFRRRRLPKNLVSGTFIYDM
ncbi:Phycobilisome linker [Gracilaria domingensis]|nr:Phycobilisome linker [Gracilaria domingensis]